MLSIRKMSVTLFYKNGTKEKYSDVDAFYSTFKGKDEVIHIRLPSKTISIDFNELESFVTCD